MKVQKLILRQRQFLDSLRELKYLLYYHSDFKDFSLNIPLHALYEGNYNPKLEDFEILCSREWKEDKIKHTHKKNYLEFNKLITHREIMINESILENDIIGREKAIELTKEIKLWLSSKYVYWICDHGGRSPHVHVLFISQFQKMRFFKEFFEYWCNKTSIPHILLPYCNIQKCFTFDLSMLNYRNGRKTVRCEGGEYLKKPNISYCSVVDKDIKPVYTEDVLFPSSSVQKLINYFKNKK